MQEFRDQTFSQLFDAPGVFRKRPQCFDGMAFYGCHFENCALRTAVQLQDRTRITNIAISQCSWARCHLGSAILENVVVNGLRCRDPLSLGEGAPLLRHVTLSGEINKLSIGGSLAKYDAAWSPRKQQAYDRISAEFYRDVDWALDIRSVIARNLLVTGIPARLIRYDQATQAVMNRRTTTLERWDALAESLKFVTQCDLFGAVGQFARGNLDEQMLVAGRLAPDFEMQVNAIDELRRVGLVEAL